MPHLNRLKNNGFYRIGQIRCVHIVEQEILAVKIAATKAPIGIMTQRLACRDIVGGSGGVVECQFAA